MGGTACQITSIAIAYTTVYTGADQRKHQSSASLAFVWGIHRWSVNSSHKWPVTRKMFPFDDVIMQPGCRLKSSNVVTLKSVGMVAGCYKGNCWCHRRYTVGACDVYRFVVISGPQYASSSTPIQPSIYSYIPWDCRTFGKLLKPTFVTVSVDVAVCQYQHGCDIF